MNSSKSGVIVILTAVIVGQVGIAQAQSGAGPGARTLEEIVVTAQRREQTIQDVPISVEVLSDNVLSRNQIHDIEALKNISASISFDSGIALKSHSFGIRGVSTGGSNTKAFQSSVGIILDGVTLARNAEFSRDLGDVERIEVLRGPQGTLFGKNATAGVINIVTKGPTEEYDGYLNVSGTNDQEWLTQGAIGGPISNRVRGRLFASYRDQNPTIENISTSQFSNDVNGRETAQFVGKLDIDLADNVLLKLAADYTDIYSQTAGQQVLIAAPGQFNKEFPVRPGDKYRINRDGPDYSTAENWGISGILNVDFSDSWTLISTTAYRHVDSHWWFDQDAGKCGVECIGEPQIQEQGNTGGVDFNREYPRADAPDYWHASNETQLQFASDNMTFIAGTYIEHLEDNLIQSGPTMLIDDDLDFIPDRIQDQTRGPSHVENDTYSAFGDVTYNITNEISVFGGLRYTHEKIFADLLNSRLGGSSSSLDISAFTAGGLDALTEDLTYTLTNGNTVVVKNVVNAPLVIDFSDYDAFPPLIDIEIERSVDNLSGRIGASWQPSEDRHYFISAARGYKGPSADLDFSATLETAVVDPELATSFEAGFKGSFGDRGHSLSIAAYNTKITDLQQNTSLPGAVPPRTQLTNIGDMRTYGVDLDFLFRVTDQFDISGSVAWTHARMINGQLTCYEGQTFEEGCNIIDPDPDGADPLQELKGLKVQAAPDWKYRIAGYYNLPLAGMPFDFYSNISWTWQDEQYFAADNNPVEIGDAYGLLDMALGLEAKSGKYNVEVFGKNVLNTWYPGTIGSTAPLYAQRLFIATRGQHSYFGARIRYNFF